MVEADPVRLVAWQRSLPWFGAATLAAPVTILLHELGHFIAYLALGFEDVRLHYGSAGPAAGSAGHPAWQAALAAAAGPIVTVVIILACCLLVARFGPHPLAVATGLVAPIRFPVGVAYIVARERGASVSGANFDELNAVRSSGIPVDVLVAFEMLVLVGSWFWLLRSIPRGQRTLALMSLLAGTVVGLALYIGVVGPLLLP